MRKIFCCSLLGAAIVIGQESAPPTTGGGGGGTTGGTTGGTGSGTLGGTPGGTLGVPGNTNTRNPSPFPQTQQRMPDFDQMQNRPVFLSGKVRMEDGSAPPETVTIERICAGRGNPVPEGYTDSKGGFGFQVGQRAGMIPDASIGNDGDTFGGMGRGGGGGNPMGRGGVSERDLMACELRASLPGYRSSIVSLAGRRTLDNPDVGTIILRRLGDVTGFTTSATSLMAPKEAKKALEKARNSLKKNKVPEAQKDLELAVAAHPKFAEAWYELGRVQAMQNNLDGARASYQKSLEADEKYVRPYLGLALMEAQMKKWPEVKELTEKVIKLNRYDFPAAFFYGAVANYNLRDAETAEKLCRLGIEADSYHSVPKMSHLLGMILADKQDYKGASEQLSAYLKFAPKANDFDQVKQQLAEINGRVAQATPQN
ncbi:MAG: tetratricopeptide repeat protein [Acidobacteria bacterium]|nr:tetratricopeptide repeat protein [Acidobacteriota bacterium]